VGRLAVPSLAGAGGVLALEEQLSSRLQIVTVAIVESIGRWLSGRRVTLPTCCQRLERH
jgi:hypothetical protein